MRLQIDTDNKIITIEEDILLKSFIELLNNMFPNNSWEAYTLSCKTIYNWINPITYPIWTTEPYIQPLTGRPFGVPAMYDATGIPPSDIRFNTGIYNIDIK